MPVTLLLRKGDDFRDHRRRHASSGIKIPAPGNGSSLDAVATGVMQLLQVMRRRQAKTGCDPYFAAAQLAYRHWQPLVRGDKSPWLSP